MIEKVIVFDGRKFVLVKVNENGNFEYDIDCSEIIFTEAIYKEECSGVITDNLFISYYTISNEEVARITTEKNSYNYYPEGTL